MDATVLAVFIAVYVGMILGRIHGLALDRTGIALLGAIVLLATGHIRLAEAWSAVDASTIALLFGLMIVSAQFRLSGFYSMLTSHLAQLRTSPEMLLAALIGATALLSAVLANDIVCLAMAPVLVQGCARRRLNPVPFLLALACAANVGSAATLIGNPQNMLIGQVLRVPFNHYLWGASLPTLLGLIVVWQVIRRQYRGRWVVHTPVPPVEAPEFSAWQTAKGTVVVLALILVFVLTPWPRGVVALSAAAVLLMSRRTSSRTMLEAVDWHLLVLFAGLFVVNDVLRTSGSLETMLGWTRRAGVKVGEPAWLFVIAALLSNLVSNVPATMLLLPVAHPLDGPLLALSSTLAGNLIVVGSIANIIVIDQAQRLGVRISWLEHARVGVPVAVLTLLIAAGWLWLLASLGW